MNENSSTAEMKVLSLEEFVKTFEKIEGAEAKLHTLIDYMSDTLNKPGSPYFKGFWEARKLCFPLFKESISPPLRSELWNRYRELTKEGRELKNMLDQETAFAVEQIDLAISSLEEDLGKEEKEGYEITFPTKIKSLEGKEDYYRKQQQTLNRLNFFASRINSLRKELVKTEMRIKHKNKFFQRLSKLGDHIFPHRKELIKEISNAFEKDVHEFVEMHFSSKHFSHEKVKKSVFFFREEIKALQAVAKLLTLNTRAFTETRQALSGCWDKLRGMEKEVKKEYADQKIKSSENVKIIRAQIAEFVEKREGLSLESAYREIDQLLFSMREMELTRNDVAMLKEEIQAVRAPLDMLKEQNEIKRKEEQQSFEKARKEKIEEFKKKIEALLECEVQEMETLLESYKKECLSLSMSKDERNLCERLLRNVRDRLSEKREATLLAMPDDTRAMLKNLERVLEERREQRREIKSQIEEYRKIMGGSSLDIEGAMKFNELMESEKERLEKCDTAITEVEQKIQEIRKT